jgi:hypothetical protein
MISGAGCGPNAAELEALAEVGALTHTDPSRPWHRREALWQVHAFAAVPCGGRARRGGRSARRGPGARAMTLAERQVIVLG